MGVQIQIIIIAIFVFLFVLQFAGRIRRVKMTKKLLKDVINVVPMKFYFLIIPKV
jgi:hypothetical protein